MALTILLGFACITVIALNILGSTTVLKSNLYTNNKKYLYLLLIWLIPIFGVMSAILLVSHDMKNIKNKSDKELLSALHDFTKRVNTISDGIKKARR